MKKVTIFKKKPGTLTTSTVFHVYANSFSAVGFSGLTLNMFKKVLVCPPSDLLKDYGQ